MMMEKTTKIENLLNELTDREKIRLFYEIAKETITMSSDDFDELDSDMQNLIEDISNVVNDIDNL